MIPLTPVTCTEIHSIGHDPDTNTLAICFKKSIKGDDGKWQHLPEPGSVYYYSNFTPEEYTAFAAAPSTGSYFYKNIKPFWDKYPFTKQP